MTPASLVRAATDEAGAAALLREVTEMEVWDWIWIEHPSPGEFGPGTAVALAGSTNLDYYMLVRLVFRGPRLSTLPHYFHHPDFSLVRPEDVPGAPPEARGALCVRVTTEVGSDLGTTGYVVADAVEVHLRPPGERALPLDYVPARPEHFGTELRFPDE